MITTAVYLGSASGFNEAFNDGEVGNWPTVLAIPIAAIGWLTLKKAGVGDRKILR